MNYDFLFRQAGRITWRHKFLWLLGLLAMAGNIAGSLAMRRVSGGNWAAVLTPEALNRFDEWFQVGPLVAGLLLLFLAGIGVWLATAVAEGGLIVAAARSQAGQPVALRQSWSAGVGLLVRFILIDTLIFLPLFFVLLALLLLPNIFLIGAVLAVAEGLAVETLLAPTLALLMILFLLSLLAVPVTVLTLLFRQLAFRSAALRQLKTREAVAHAWQILRANWLSVLILLCIGWALRSLLGGFMLVLTLPSLLLMDGAGLLPAASLPGWLQWAGNLLFLLAEIARAAGHALLHVFISVLWTTAFLSWIKDEAEKQPRTPVL